MKTIQLLLLFIFLIMRFELFSQTNRNDIYEVRINLDSIDGVYIPRDLNDCMKQLDIILSDSAKKCFKNSETALYHFSLGLWLRNSWCLWSGSRLSVYFEKLDVNFPDNMSAIILNAYKNKLNNQPYSIEYIIQQREQQKNKPDSIFEGYIANSPSREKKFYEVLYPLGLKVNYPYNAKESDVFKNYDYAPIVVQSKNDTTTLWTLAILGMDEFIEIEYSKNELISSINSGNFPDYAYISYFSNIENDTFSVCYNDSKKFFKRNDSLFFIAKHYIVPADSVYDMVMQSDFKVKGNELSILNKFRTDVYLPIFHKSFFTKENYLYKDSLYNFELTLEGFWLMDNDKFYKLKFESDYYFNYFYFYLDKNLKIISIEDSGEIPKKLKLYLMDRRKYE
jgi:hypothetical protein